MNISSLELWVPALWFDLLSPWCQAWVSYTPSPAQKSSSSETLCTHLWHTHTHTHTRQFSYKSVKYPAVVWKENGLKQISWQGKRIMWETDRMDDRRKAINKEAVTKEWSGRKYYKIVWHACYVCFCSKCMGSVRPPPPPQAIIYI